jgi:hypothetical protein
LVFNRFRVQSGPHDVNPPFSRHNIE